MYLKKVNESNILNTIYILVNNFQSFHKNLISIGDSSVDQVHMKQYELYTTKRSRR